MAADDIEGYEVVFKVSTHSHPKVAAIAEFYAKHLNVVSTHSHPKVAAACI